MGLDRMFGCRWMDEVFGSGVWFWMDEVFDWFGLGVWL